MAAIYPEPHPDPNHIYSFGESYRSDALVSEAFGKDRLLAYRLVNFENGPGDRGKGMENVSRYVIALRAEIKAPRAENEVLRNGPENMTSKREADEPEPEAATAKRTKRLASAKGKNGMGHGNEDVKTEDAGKPVRLPVKKTRGKRARG